MGFAFRASLLGALTLAALTLLQPARATAPVAQFTAVNTISVPAGAEIVAATGDGQFLAVAGDTSVTLLDFSEAPAATEICNLDLTGFGANITSVAFASSTVGLAAVKDDPNPGTLVAYSVPGCEVLWDLELGIGPDSVVVSPNGKYAAVAIEDEESEIGEVSTVACDPGTNERPGRVDVVQLTGPGAPAVTHVEIELVGVPGVFCQDDPQPEGIAISSNSRQAFVTLQENNALAIIDLKAGATTGVVSLGLTTHLADLTDGGHPAVITELMTGRRESDGIAYLGGYLFTADEGDTDDTEGIWSGGRTLSVFDPSGTLVTDTGSAIEELVNTNPDAWNDMAGRANNRGPEPEGITAFTRNGLSYAVVLLERANAVAVFDVTDPSQPHALQLVQTGDGPEGVVYLKGQGMLVTANEVARSLTVIAVD